MNIVEELEREQMRDGVPELRPGDTVRVHAKVVEGTRERVQVFEGVVIRVTGGGLRRNVTVRRIAHGVGVERTFLVHSPRVDRIQVVRHGQVRQARLYYLRGRTGRAARIRERREDRFAPGGAGRTGAATAPGRAVAETAPEPEAEPEPEPEASPDE